MDLAAESGGNVEGVKPGEELTVDGVLLWGGRNVPSHLPAQASQLYSTNVVNLLLLMRSGCVTHRGEVRHAPTKDLLDNGGGEEQS